jgi:outer membrane protein TolC
MGKPLEPVARILGMIPLALPSKLVSQIHPERSRIGSQVTQIRFKVRRLLIWCAALSHRTRNNNLSTFDDTPVGVLRDRDRLFAFGVSITLPIFNRNQGAKAEAQLEITQAQKRCEFIESVVRAEVAAAYRRYEAAQASVRTYERGVIARSEQSVQTMRAAYQVGAFRVTELLAEQRRLVDMQREMTEALAERYRALAELRAALGIAD